MAEVDVDGTEVTVSEHEPSTTTSEKPLSGADVEVRIAATPAHLSVLRAVAADLAMRADFTLDAIPDLKMAADDPRRTELRDRLVTEFLPVAQHIARRFGQRGEPHDDLVQVATVGLISAIDRFDPTRGSDFLSFAVPTIMGEVRRHFRDTSWS